jgi:hypothetical protein
VLRLERDGTLHCGFDGLECRGGAVYAVGRRSDAEPKHGFGRTVLYEKRALGPADFGVLVSSHVDYEKSTVEPLLKSLRKAGFDMARVLVVVDGDKKWADWGDDRGDGVKVLRSDLDAMGFCALAEAGRKDAPEYSLLVHDTCEFERDFSERMAKVDVGLGQDVALLMPPEAGCEMGLYSARFVKECGVDLAGTRPGQLFGAFMRQARVVTVVGGKVEVAGEKDVYGSGTKRRVVRMPAVGLRKYQGRSARGGRP